MNNRPSFPKDVTSRRGRGFNLVVTVTILVLLSLIAVGLLSLSASVFRSTKLDKEVMEARANARLGLHLAIGELQKTMGPDTRISANGSILASQTTVDPFKEQITGAWNAWKIDPSNIGSYLSRKRGKPRNDLSSSAMPIPQGGFYRWLVSAPDPEAVRNVDFISAPPSTSVTLIPPHGSDTVGVKAETISIFREESERGRFAWAVFDEGQKAALNAYAKLSSAKTFETLETMNLQTEPAWANVEEWTSLADLEEGDREKLVSTKTLELASGENFKDSVHDLTHFSSSVLSNVVDGGLKTDLSLLFEQETLPADYANRHLYSNSDEPIVGIPPRGSHPYKLPSPDPKWSLLHDFYRIPLDIYNPQEPKITFNPGTTRGSNFPLRLINNRTNPDYHNQLRIAPVISKAQFIFSLTLAQGAALNNAWKTENSSTGRNGSRWKAQVLMIIDPVITLWNPYDIPIDVEKFRIYLYRMPISFKFTSDNPNFHNPTIFTDFTLSVGAGANSNTAYAYPLSILPEVDGEPILMQPGEHRVFSAHDYQTVSSVGNAYEEGKAIEMRPGWHPPGTRGEDAENIGGLSTEHICKTPSQQASASYTNDNGQRKNVTTILVGTGDQISINVKPSNSSTATASFATLGGQSSDFYLRYGAWAEDSEIQSASEQDHLGDFGAIELNYESKLEDRDLFPEYRSGVELPTYPIDANDLGIAETLTDAGHQNTNSHSYSPSPRGTVLKKPFLIASLHLRDLVGTSYTSKLPSKAWIHNNPTALYASAGFGGDEADLSAQQYEFSYQPLQGSWDNGVPEISGDRHQGFGGPAPDAENGRPYAPMVSLPRARLTSLAQFRHTPLNQTGKQPLQAQVAGNSFAHPLLEANEVVNEEHLYLDHSFLANQSLFDTTFFSTAHGQSALRKFLTNEEPIVESRYFSVFTGKDQELDDLIPNNASGYRNSASLLMMSGGFNVNSTSVKAWSAFLSGINQEKIPFLKSFEDSELGTLDNPKRRGHTSRFQLPLEQSLGGVLDPFGSEDDFAWTGYRRLEAEEIQELAEKVVQQVKQRGPFQSLGEFLNRRAESNGSLGISGALQTAIDASSINAAAESAAHIAISGDEAGSDDYEHVEAAAGNSLTGTPGYLTQGDLLQTIAPYLHVRSDTFKIRSYGSSIDQSGRTRAEAWCEAVVQRTPEFLDTSDQPHEFIDENGVSELDPKNEKFGRRFQVISFRWLADPTQTSASYSL